MNMFVWIGIAFCITQSAMFSGLNLAFFSISKLRLEIETKKGNRNAEKILKLRRNSNFLLTTILWGNVGINVLLTLLSNSAMAGAISFVFSTFIITFFGEIIPQAYFSRHAMRTAAMLSPVLRVYQLILWPVAKPSSMILDLWLGPEGIHFFKEKDLKELLKIHMNAPETEIDHIEGRGALNFLAMDDIPIMNEGESVAEASILQIEFSSGIPVFPPISKDCNDAFILRIQAARKKWVILTDSTNYPRMSLDADGFLRAALLEGTDACPLDFCHRPIVVSNPQTPLGEVLRQLKVESQRIGDYVIDHDLILFWADEKRIITGADILGRLLQGIVQQQKRGAT